LLELFARCILHTPPFRPVFLPPWPPPHQVHRTPQLQPPSPSVPPASPSCPTPPDNPYWQNAPNRKPADSVLYLAPAQLRRGSPVPKWLLLPHQPPIPKTSFPQSTAPCFPSPFERPHHAITQPLHNRILAPKNIIRIHPKTRNSHLKTQDKSGHFPAPPAPHRLLLSPAHPLSQKYSPFLMPSPHPPLEPPSQPPRNLSLVSSKTPLTSRKTPFPFSKKWTFMDIFPPHRVHPRTPPSPSRITRQSHPSPRDPRSFLLHFPS